MEVQKILSTGITLASSGTTGTPKEIFQSPEKLRASNLSAIDSQQITYKSRIYTVCKMAHAGGMLAQTLPALSIGCDVLIEDFNAYKWVKNVKFCTHTHLTPKHCKAIMGTKGWQTLDLNGIWITCGSDIVEWYVINAFVKKGATFMTNWGMTEIGPCAINTVFDSVDKVEEYRSKIVHGIDGQASLPILGDRFYCDYKVVKGELYVKGDICVYNEWFDTGDMVEFTKECLFYRGRK